MRFPLAVLFLVLSLTCGNPAEAAINLNIDQIGFNATSNNVVGDEIRVSVSFNSTFEIQSITARVDDREAPVTFSLNGGFCDTKGQCGSGWSARFSLAGLTEGGKIVRITAADVFGNTGQAQGTFTYDRFPQLTILEPMPEIVGRPQIRVSVRCDDGQQVCNSLNVYMGSEQGSSLILTGKSAIDTTVSLSSQEGRAVTLRFEGTDTAGRSVSATRTVYVESSVRLVPEAEVTGRILDVTADRILFVEEKSDRSVLKIKDRNLGNENMVMDQPGKRPQYGFLTPKGAIFVEQGGNVVTAVLVDFRDGSLVELGPLNASSSLRVNGQYAIWNDWATNLHFRDLVSGTDVLIAPPSGYSDIGNDRNDVAANGDVVFWAHGLQPSVFRFRQGSVVQLADGIYPVTDGTSVAYASTTTPYAVSLTGLAENLLLAQTGSLQPEPIRDYQLNDGWTAFPRVSASDEMVRTWLRSPTGVERQVVFFGTPSSLDRLGPGGDLTLLSGNRRYLFLSDGGLFETGSALGKSFRVGNQWLVAIGGSLFTIDVTPKPDGDLTGNAVIDLRDALHALRAVVGLTELSDDERLHGDVAPLLNGKPAPDGSVTLQDALVILRRVVGLVSW